MEMKIMIMLNFGIIMEDEPRNLDENIIEFLYYSENTLDIMCFGGL